MICQVITATATTTADLAKSTAAAFSNLRPASPASPRSSLVVIADVARSNPARLVFPPDRCSCRAASAEAAIFHTSGVSFGATA